MSVSMSCMQACTGVPNCVIWKASMRYPNSLTTDSCKHHACCNSQVGCLIIFGIWLYVILHASHSSADICNICILSDSMSSLEALNGVKFELDLVQKIIKDYTHLTNNGKTIIFCWIPSHVNIPGNEKAGTLCDRTTSVQMQVEKTIDHRR